jgi:hypothetical protein
VLSDPLQRKAYDGYGKNSISLVMAIILLSTSLFDFGIMCEPIWMCIAKIRDNILDGTVVFTLLFRSELFVDYIGNLALATMASSELTSDNDNPEKLQDRLKVSRLNKQAVSVTVMDAKHQCYLFFSYGILVAIISRYWNIEMISFCCDQECAKREKRS